MIDLIEKNELYRFDDEYYAVKKDQLAATDIESEKGSSTKKETKPKANKGSGIPTTINLSNARNVSVSSNKIKFVTAKEGDTPESIAENLDLPKWVIRKYNDLESDATISTGDIIYIQPKRGKAQSNKHTVKQGETMRSISQLHGIKLKSLYKKNNLKFGSQPSVGTTLSLRKKVK